MSDDSFFFCCHFHNEGTPSMRINSHTNKLYCYGCGMSEDIFGYVMQYHNLSYKNAKNLIAAISNIELPNNPYSNDAELVKYYQSAYNLRRFKTILDIGVKRANPKPKTLYNYLALKKCEQGYKILDRIKDNKILKQTNNIYKSLRLEINM
ncbi:MAG: hypothetical protein J1F35_07885 [Erysipelotrichales bacterium]|nr:hypothetical protein [Erysipelotrichales bacterium]